jgi:flagellar basal-body rod modification protein FlgD
LQTINTTLGDVSTSQTVLTNSQAVDYIGKQIQAIGDHVYVNDGRADPIEFDVAEDAAGVYVKIYNQYGEYVQDLELGPMAAGQHSIQWDGLDHKGQTAPDGAYQYEAAAIDADGNTVSVTSFTRGTVTGVYYKNGIAYLETADQEVPLGSVVQVFAPGQ